MLLSVLWLILMVLLLSLLSFVFVVALYVHAYGVAFPLRCFFSFVLQLLLLVLLFVVIPYNARYWDVIVTANLYSGYGLLCR